MRATQQGNTLGSRSRKSGSGILERRQPCLLWLCRMFLLLESRRACCDMRWHLKLCDVEGAVSMVQGARCFWAAAGEEWSSARQTMLDRL